MRKGERIFGLIGLGLSCWLLWEASKFDYMTQFTPGPGFHPFWLGVCLGLLSFYLFIDTFRRKPSKEDEKVCLPGQKSLMRLALIMLATAAFAFFMTTLGFVLTTFIFVAFILAALEGYNPFKSIVYGAFFSGSIFFIFRYWLEVDLPRGFLGL
jgi:putative tricarboxylic transport membrane protein